MGQTAPNERVVAVIDDDQSVRGAIRSLLRSLGFRVETFASAEDFLDARPAGIGCLILDVRLSGMSGLDLQQRLAVTGDAPPIVFISAHADQDARRGSDRLPAQAVCRGRAHRCGSPGVRPPRDVVDR